MECLPQIPPLELGDARESQWRGSRKSVRARGSGRQQKNKALCLNWTRFIWDGTKWSNMHSACMGLHQVLYVYIIDFRVKYLWDSCVCVNNLFSGSCADETACLLLRFKSYLTVKANNICSCLWLNKNISQFSRQSLFMTTTQPPWRLSDCAGNTLQNNLDHVIFLHLIFLNWKWRWNSCYVYNDRSAWKRLPKERLHTTHLNFNRRTCGGTSL